MSKRRGTPVSRPRHGAPGRRITPPRSPHDQVRAEAARVLERTLASRSPVDSFLEAASVRCDPRDVGLLWELVLGALRWLRRLDHVIARASDRPLDRIEPALLAPLRIGVYQLLFLDRVPSHAVVNEAVEHALAVTHRGGASFVNAVLRRVARDPTLAAWPVEEKDPVRRLALELSHPDFLVEGWWRRLGAEATRRLLLANNRPKPMHLLAFRDHGGRELLAESLIDEGCEVEASALSPLGLKVRGGAPLETAAYRRGDFYVQDEAAQAASLVPPPAPGERVLDVAAAPGGKSFALQALEPSVDCVLADSAPDRIGLVRANLRRLRRCVPLIVADARRPPFTSRWDRVVVDAPCSGSGTLRKHPELKWRLSPPEVSRLAEQSLALLASSSGLVRPGGLLVLITCSLEEEENERVIERFLAHGREFEPLDLERSLDGKTAQHITGPGLWRVWTDGDHDGFTAAVMVRDPAS
ncbi:MAG TPA: transcription antitermination factor NusB [Thermoanaerobaculia bacterium]|nr:transcription antitermination factor NusB [Thermoanaerobaculia bacterium]